MIFNFNKCLTAALLAIAILSVAYIFENNKSNSYADTSTYFGGDIVSYNMCLIGDTPTTLSFPLITKDIITTVELVSIDGSVDNHLTSSLSFDPSDFITYNEYNIYNFSLTFKNNDPYGTGYSLVIPKFKLKINDVGHIYETPFFTLCNDTYLSNDNEYHINTDKLIISDTNTAYYTLPTSDNLASLTLFANSDVTLMNIKPTEFFSMSDFTINQTPADAQNIYMKLKKDNNFKISYALNYTDYKYADKIVKSSLIIKYKYNDNYYMYISNTPLYVFPGYSKNYAMERYIDNL